MIDIHAHILPGIDDGPESIDESISMARAAVDDGTTVMVATPHTLNGLYLNKRDDIIEKVKLFKDFLSNNNIPITVLPGSDVALTPELIPALDSNEVITINDNKRYILVELPFAFHTEKIKEIIFQLRKRGLTPVLTHPERDGVITKDPQLLADFIDMGCLSQITVASLAGSFGPAVMEFSEFILRQGMAHILASDCHSPERRRPGLTRGYEAASEIVGTEQAETMVKDLPKAVIEGEHIDIPEYLPIKKRRRRPFWKR